MPIPKPNSGENLSKFMQRCLSDEIMVDEYDIEQRAAICKKAFEKKLEGKKISFDFDSTLTTEKGMELSEKLISEGANVYIISARSNQEPMLARAERLGIPQSRIYATGSNKAKIEKIKDLDINTHYDNNPDVIKELGTIGKLI